MTLLLFIGLVLMPLAYLTGLMWMLEMEKEDEVDNDSTKDRN